MNGIELPSATLLYALSRSSGDRVGQLVNFDEYGLDWIRKIQPHELYHICPPSTSSQVRSSFSLLSLWNSPLKALSLKVSLDDFGECREDTHLFEHSQSEVIFHVNLLPWMRPIENVNRDFTCNISNGKGAASGSDWLLEPRILQEILGTRTELPKRGNMTQKDAAVWVGWYVVAQLLRTFR